MTIVLIYEGNYIHTSLNSVCPSPEVWYSFHFEVWGNKIEMDRGAIICAHYQLLLVLW